MGTRHGEKAGHNRVYSAGDRVWNRAVSLWGTVRRPGTNDGWYVVLRDDGQEWQWFGGDLAYVRGA
jgi:hypothetical protein